MRALRTSRPAAALAAAALLLASCGGGGGGVSPSAGSTTNNGAPTTTSVLPAPALEALTSAEVGQVVAQAVGEATARGLPSTIAVVDRVGNVLAVFAMTGARPMTQIDPGPSGTNFDAQGVPFVSPLGAISKAITAAYLSSGGNAFTPRTASEIVQQEFPPTPGAVGLESGPLFGVQFSSLPCSDLVSRYAAAGGAAALIGPKRSPLGLSADPGAVPLYKNGVLVGGVGIMGDGKYSLDKDVADVDTDDEEYIALAGSTGFQAPAAITADKVNIDGTTLRFIDAVPAGLKSTPASAPAFAAIQGSAGTLVGVRGYYAEGQTPALLAGTPYGSEASGIRRVTAAEFSNGDAYVLSNGSGANRYPPRGGTDGGDGLTPLTASETRALLEEAFSIMSRARGAIRQPLDSRAQVTISVVDTRGQILGIVRGPDAPVFGTDVSLQKARTAAFLSSPHAADELAASPSADVSGRVAMVRAFLGDQTALTGKVAFSARAVGSLARPFFPDGEVSQPPGPLSRPIAQFSPFSTGLQSALIVGNLAQHIGYVQGGADATDTPRQCTQQPNVAGTGANRLANGLQIFSGSHPIYRGSTLVGAIGVSGDGIDQDDMISFLGVANAGKRTGTIGLADPATRADRVVVTLPDGRTARLLYVQCPFAPFVGTSDQNVCEGI